MNYDELTIRVAAGLRAIKKTPEAFLFLDGWQDWTCDMPSILQIPVFHAEGLSCAQFGCNAIDCPVIPIGGEGKISLVDRTKFAEAFSV